jgi:toxin HigB-1
MIKSSASSAAQQFLETGKSKFSGMDVNKAKMRVAMLHGASSLDDISPLKSVRIGQTER